MYTLRSVLISGADCHNGSHFDGSKTPEKDRDRKRKTTIWRRHFLSRQMLGTYLHCEQQKLAGSETSWGPVLPLGLAALPRIKCYSLYVAEIFYQLKLLSRGYVAGLGGDIGFCDVSDRANFCRGLHVPHMLPFEARPITRPLQYIPVHGWQMLSVCVKE